MRLGWSLVALSVGTFALVAQTLLFRSFLAALEGSEIAVGIFFATWLLWVGIGALAARAITRAFPKAPDVFPLAALLYLPGYLLQHALASGVRALAGVEAYDLLPLDDILWMALLVNAPVSFLTGFLFTLACGGAARVAAFPVARVYVLESAGAFAGGLVATAMLFVGLREERVFLAAALLLSAATASFYTLRRGTPAWQRIGVAALPLVIGVLLLLRVDVPWSQWTDRSVFGRLLPAECYRGTFTTSHARYLHGEHDGAFVVLGWGGVAESLPSVERGAEVVALTLAQRPRARRVLVVGPGALSICLRYLALPDIDRVTWIHPDPAYPAALEAVLPPRLRALSRRVETPAVDVREHLQQNPGTYDLAVVATPDVTTLVLNRYATVEFFRLLEASMGDDGTIAYRLSGGENYLGSELVLLGSSVYATLRSLFRHVVLKPGEESWLIASDREGLTGSPAVLRDRFGSVRGAATVYPPEGLFSLYPPDRAEAQLEKYEETLATAAPDVLINTDREPRSLLYALAVAVRRATHRSVAPVLETLLAVGFWLPAGAILLYAALRWLYLARSPPLVGTSSPSVAPPAALDALYLVFSTGMVGMTLSVVVMFLYQASHGALFLYVGLLASLFMLGLTGGSFTVERYLARRTDEPALLLPSLLVLFLAVASLPWFLSIRSGVLVHGVTLLGSGAATGACFPVAAHRMRRRRAHVTAAAARLETVDHLGGAAGAALTGIFFLPLLGTERTLALTALLIASNLVPQLWRRRLRSASPFPLTPVVSRVRAGAYVLLGVASFLLMASNLLSAAGRRDAASRYASVLEELVAGARTTEESTPLPDGEQLRHHVVLSEAAEPSGYVFSSRPLVDDVVGYGGPLDLLAHVTKEGRLLGYRILQSRETPEYLSRLAGWNSTILGRDLFERAPFEGVDAVSGATVSSRAILETLEAAGHRFSRAALGLEGGATEPTASRRRVGRSVIVLGVLLAAAVLVRYVPRPWIRRALLFASVALAGLWLNAQYSTQQVLSLLALDWPRPEATSGFLLVVVVPLVVLLFGNVYCGHVCPFGALQELAGDLRPPRVATDPTRGVWYYGRLVKYVILFVVVSLFALSRSSVVTGMDPLLTFFSWSGGAIWLGAAALLFSFPFRRFWCRNLCPAGAFLSIVGRARVLRKLLPHTAPARCDLGVRSPRELDCLVCDRCRHAKS